MRTTASLIVLSCLLFFGGCVPLDQLEQENVDLRSKVDSLTERQDACTTQMATLATRIEALEKENRQLSDANKQMTTRLSEMASLPAVSTEPTEPPPQVTAPTEPVQQTAQSTVQPTATLPSQPSAQPAAQQSAPKTEQEEEPPAKPQAKTAPKQEQPRKQQFATTYVPPVVSISSSEPADEAFLSRYQNALAAFNARKYNDAIQQFNDLLNSSKANDMTDNCAYWIGEALYAQKNDRDAIPWFTKVLLARSSDKLGAALMMRGNAYLRLDQPSKAGEDFQRIVSEFPNTEFYTIARTKLKSIRNAPKGSHVVPGK